jgi:hypothetical protein
MATIKAIRNHVIFQFEDKIKKKTNHGKETRQFEEETDWGFQVSNYDDGTKTPRWAIVVAVGGETDDDIRVGSRILIEPLQWTEAIEFEGIPYWRTDDQKIIGIDDDYHP